MLQAMMNATSDIDTSWLRISGISRRFGNRDVLRDITLSVGQGEIICLVGPSGCGKSTLLRLVAGVDQADTGEIWLAGDLLASPGRSVEPEDRSIGFMFQDYALFPHLSVAQNIAFGLRKRPKAEAARLMAGVIARLGIGHLTERYPHMLSGGEQQRIALARALAPQPRVMLMDEPFSNLDRNLRDSVRDETLALLRETGTTAVMVTHDPEEALSAADRVALMRAGRIEQFGPASTIYDQPASPYAAEFFGQCNRFDAVCHNAWVETPLGCFAAPGIENGRAVTVYVRPQAIAVTSSTDAIKAVVTGVKLMGEIEQISVSVAALPVPLTLRATQRLCLQPGQKVGISLKDFGVFVFESDLPLPNVSA